MEWNWQQSDWPNFSYTTNDIEPLEQQFLHGTGIMFGAYKHLNNADRHNIIIKIISYEALKTSEIEGEHLNHESLQASICKHFGLKTDRRRIPPAEQGISDLLLDLYHHYNAPLSHDMLYHWHRMITNGRIDLLDIGKYRTDPEPMQIISGPLHKPTIHFEAPPSKQVSKEMDHFIKWFNHTAPDKENALPNIVRAGITHLYFESIHPFEDGNGRIGRALSEKALSQGLGQPTLIALATLINQDRKAYYKALENASKSNDISQWLEYFASIILDSLRYTEQHIEFLIKKAKLFDRLRNQLNPRQEKCLLRMFDEGPKGFTGGLSAENYLAITQTSRPTATRDLADLVQKKAFTKTGTLRHTRYYLNLH